MHATPPLLAATDFPPPLRTRLDTLRVNPGYRSMQRCLRTHANAGLDRTGEMEADAAALARQALRTRRPRTLDLTGGALDRDAVPAGSAAIPAGPGA